MSDVDEVKSRINIVDVIGAKVTLKKAGRHFKALCPFHSEKTPSFIVSPERQIWKCFGCGKGGSVIDFVMEYEHVDFLEALEELAEKAGVKLERRAGDTPEAKLKQQVFAVNHLASEFYQYLLTKHVLGEKARLYLKARGVTDKAIKTFSLGYSPNSWDGLAKYLRKKGYDSRLLEQAGLVIASARGGYDRFRGRVMFALKDHRGNVVGFSGRLLDPEAKEAKYINTSDTPVYNKSTVLYGFDVTRDAIQKANEAIITEGEFDVISSFQAGIANVVAIKGSALTEGHVNLLRRFTERVVFALDSDVAGDAASRRGIEIADRAGLDMKVVILGSGKDPDEAVRENPGLFKKAVAAAVPIYDYFISSATKRFDATTAFGKRKISEEVLTTLAHIDNSIVQNHYIKKLAAVLDTSEEAVGEALRKISAARQTGTSASSAVIKQERSRSEKLALYALALLLQGDTRTWHTELIGAINLSDFVQPAVARIIEALGKVLNKDEKKEFSVKEFAATLPSELLSTMDEAFLWDLGAILGHDDRQVLEWQHALRELTRDILHRAMKLLTKALREADGKSPKDTADLHQKLNEVTGKLKQLENPG